MKKYIHYCWFGDNPLPKLAKKCIKSWKKYLPDYEIVEWNENNVDLNECPFIKEAYENKKWAFVADYVRTKALYNQGGLYLDTDMEITKNIDDILKDSFLGVEDSGKIAAGIWNENETKSYLTTKLLEYYQNQKMFDVKNIFKYAIPVLMTEILKHQDFNEDNYDTQVLKDKTVIYKREYFYPLSYNRENNIFTENTRAIHYYDASWIPKAERREIKIFRFFGRKNGQKFIELIRKLKKIIKLCLFPIFLPRKIIREKKIEIEKQRKFEKNLSELESSTYLTIYRNGWLGTMFATKEIMPNCIGIDEVDTTAKLEYYATQILNKKPNLIIFSAFDLTWKELILKIKEKKPSQNIKILWHGSKAVNTEDYDWTVLRNILDMSKEKIISSIGFAKESMYEFYKEKGYNCEFVMNTVHINKNEFKLKIKEEKVKIGVYASGDRWVKNFYNQLSAASLIKNHQIDCIPISKKTKEFCSYINANICGIDQSIPRIELLERLSQNNINLYTTFVECSPMLPLESMELGVPCITSDNHHYWKNTELEKYLIVSAPDNIITIKEKIEEVLKNKEKIMEMYLKWKIDYDKEVEKNLKQFLDWRKK